MCKSTTTSHVHWWSLAVNSLLFPAHAQLPASPAVIVHAAGGHSRQGPNKQWCGTCRYPNNFVLRLLTPQDTCRPLDIYPIKLTQDAIYVDVGAAASSRAYQTTRGGADSSIERNNVYALQPKSYIQGQDPSGDCSCRGVSLYAMLRLSIPPWPLIVAAEQPAQTVLPLPVSAPSPVLAVSVPVPVIPVIYEKAKYAAITTCKAQLMVYQHRSSAKMRVLHCSVYCINHTYAWG